MLQYAVLYEARANTGVDRMKIIDAVAKSVPEPHKVDLKSPDKNIVVQIARVKNLCPLIYDTMVCLGTWISFEILNLNK